MSKEAKMTLFDDFTDNMLEDITKEVKRKVDFLTFERSHTNKDVHVISFSDSDNDEYHVMLRPYKMMGGRMNPPIYDYMKIEVERIRPGGHDHFQYFHVEHHKTRLSQIVADIVATLQGLAE